MNYDLPIEEVVQLECNPTKNKDAIILIKQEDGNWRGFMNRNGKLVQSRQGDPNTVLNMLLTHE